MLAYDNLEIPLKKHWSNAPAGDRLSTSVLDPIQSDFFHQERSHLKHKVSDTLFRLPTQDTMPLAAWFLLKVHSGQQTLLHKKILKALPIASVQNKTYREAFWIMFLQLELQDTLET